MTLAEGVHYDKALALAYEAGRTGELGMNAGGNCFGQGNRANATIGRTVKPALTNLGGALPGDEYRATFGIQARVDAVAPEIVAALLGHGREA